MMTDPLVWVDRAHDRSAASNGVSRYQAYLEAREEMFKDAEPIGYAAAAWTVATSPVMTPGYVEWRPDLHTVTVQHDDDGRLVAVLKARLPHRPLLRHGLLSDLGKLADWQRERAWSAVGEGYAYFEPRADRDALLITARLVVHLDEQGLPDPADADGLDAGLAMDAVDHLVDEINHCAKPLVDELRGVAR